MLNQADRRYILDIISEDCTPFFDVTAVVRDSHPHLTEEVQIEVARSFVVTLLERGWVTLCYDCLARSTEWHRHTEPLTQAQAKSELADTKNWLFHTPRGPDKVWVALVLTERGEAALALGEKL